MKEFANSPWRALSGLALLAALAPVANAQTAAPALFVSARTTNSITVGWSPISGATYYRIEVSTDGFVNNRTQDQVNAPATSKAYSGLPAGTTYWFRAYAGGASPSNWSSILQTATLTVLTAPTLTAGTSVINATAVSWTAVSGAEAYVLEVSADSAFSAIKQTFQMAGTGTTVNLLKWGSTNYYRVKAIVNNPYTTGPLSNTVQATVPSGIANASLAAPSNPSETMLTDHPYVSWSGTGGPYTVSVCADQACSYILRQTAGINTQYSYDGSGNSNTVYMVQQCPGGNCGNYTSPFWLGSVPAPPPTPVAATATPTPPAAPAWQYIGAGTAFVSVSAGNIGTGKIAGTSTLLGDGNNYLLNWVNGFTYTMVAGAKVAMAQTSIASDGTWWGLKANGAIYRWTGSSFTLVAGTLKQISVGSATNIWGVNSAGVIYKWSGTSWTTISAPTTIANVSAASDGTVWAIGGNGAIYRYTGSGWSVLPGAAVQVSAGSASNVWVVTSTGIVFKWNTTTSTWDTRTDAGSCKAVAASADGGALVIRNSDSSIYKKP